MTEVKRTQEVRYGSEAVTLDNAIYVIGGKNGSSTITTTVERYSPLLDRWSYVASTRNTYLHFSAISHQNKIYALSPSGFEVFHPEANFWEDLPSLNIEWGAQLVSINDKLWVVGIKLKGKEGKTVYEFNTDNHSWIHLPDMDIARRRHGAVVVNL